MWKCRAEIKLVDILEENNEYLKVKIFGINLKVKIDELSTYSKIQKNIRDLYRGINDFK
jgi:hypothetical protein